MVLAKKGAGGGREIVWNSVWNENRSRCDEGFLDGSVAQNPPANAGYVGLIPGSGRSPEEGNGNPLQYSCLENSIERGAWWATVHGVALTPLSN